MGHEATRWVLVAGTGQFELPPAVNWTARAAGRALARAGYGLVVGGWQGVDYVAAESFQAELLSAGKAVSSYLTQVVPNGSAPDFEGGYVVSVKPGPQEWVQGVKYADAVVLIGGVGATYTTYLFATQESRPVFPIAGTGNDARLAFTNILAHWNALPMEGVSKEVFASALGRGISSEQDAERVVNDLMSLLGRRFSLVSPHSQSERRLVFISYSHRDKEWLEKLRTHLSPLERQGKVFVWADTGIEAGEQWREQIRAALLSAGVAVFLVSPTFLASDFINKSELPPLLEAAKANRVRILWVHTSASMYKATSLNEVQAAHDISMPLDQLTPAMQNAVLVEICNKILEACSAK